ncbi:DNA helicase [Tanacetum coccineum]
MKVKRKLVHNSYPLSGDSNVVSANVGHHVYDANSNVSPKKQRFGDLNFTLSPAIGVTSSGVRNMINTNIVVVLNMHIGQPIAMAHQSNTLPDSECERLLQSVVRTNINSKSKDMAERTADVTDSGKLDSYCDQSSCLGSLCPADGEPPRFLQLYIYDTDNEVDNRLSHYGGDDSTLRIDIVEGLIDLLDSHNALVQLFRTAREKFQDTHVPNFKVRLYNVVGVKEYELPTGDMLGAIVYKTGPESDMDYDIILEERSGHPQRVNKLHPSYMSLQFPLLFIYGEDGYSKDLKMVGSTNSSSKDRRLTIADIVDRVFEMKIHQFINYLRDIRPFGKVVAVLYTVEIQKRGLPHCRTLLWIDESVRVRQDENIDTYVSAELPSQHIDPQGYRIVSELMMHSPCGLANPSATCTQNSSRCKKDFPKEYCNQTYVDKSGFIHYKRRDTGVTTTRQDVSLDNRYVVPYNKQLLLAFYARINVEYCGWTMLIKYLFKYISKGTDRIVARISRNNPTSVSNNTTPSTSRQPIVIDEIKNYLDARYISPHEACWRIFEFEIHYREPVVQILAVHLQNMQRIVFKETDHLDSLVLNSHKKKTTLTEWLFYNEENTDGRHLTYLNFPSEYVWYPNGKYWRRQQIKTKSSIGRLAYVHPTAGDLFYQRMLLCHQTGCTSFPGIRTVNNIVYPTCRAACEALGLLQDDREWEITLQEAALSATPAELRTLLAHIFAYCLHVDDSDLEDYMLYEFETCLNHCSKSVTDFGLRLPPAHLMSVLINRLLMEEKSYDRELLAIERDKLLPKLNENQRQIFNLIVSACLNNQQELVFVYGHGGTGKTFLWKSILYTLRCERKIVLAVASSGIASLLLPAGRTAHSRFKIPLDLTDTSVCAIKKNTQLADLLKEILMATISYPDIVAASKGKMIAIEPEVANIRSLKPTDSNKTIEVIVYRKWVSNGNIIQLALWHEMALEFNVSEYEKMEKPVVIACARFTSHATIYKISTQNKWYYQRCTIYKNQVIPEDPIPICKNHGPQPTPTYSNQANSLVKDCSELLNELPDKNPYQLPSTLKELEGTTHIRSPSQQSPTSLGQPEDPMKNQQEEEPVDLAQPFTKEDPSHTNLKTDIVQFNTEEAPTNVSADIQASQSTPPQIKNLSETHKGNQPNDPIRRSARKTLFKDAPETEPSQVSKKIKHDK